MFTITMRMEGRWWCSERTHRSAVILTLMELCKRHGIEPQAYLMDILKMLPAMTNREEIRLTPVK